MQQPSTISGNDHNSPIVPTPVLSMTGSIQTVATRAVVDLSAR
jgi:hypothetical protein